MAGDKIFLCAKIATMVTSKLPYGLIDDGAIVVSDDIIKWVGEQVDLPPRYAGFDKIDLGKRLITPGLIDCHSHVIFGGDRADEFEMRLNGASYEEIARAGGGINSTVVATRAASVDELIDKALPIVDAMIAEGVSTLEIKSGYGLECEAELNMLRAARKIGERRQITVKTSYLGAHAVPAEYRGRDDDYITDVVIATLRIAHAQGLVDAIDGFCEGIAFTPAQIARVFDVAQELQLPVKLHAEQLSNSGGAILAASYGALSVDHIEYLDHAGVEAIAASGTSAVILPGAFYSLGETQAPPIKLLRLHKVPMAVATDCNPGSSPLSSILLAANMACTLFGMTPEEALRGVTRNAALALGLSDRGAIAPGMRADLAAWNITRPGELAYTIGFNPLHQRIYGGDLS